jgi:hypothetical protein
MVTNLIPIEIQVCVFYSIMLNRYHEKPSNCEGTDQSQNEKQYMRLFLR